MAIFNSYVSLPEGTGETIVDILVVFLCPRGLNVDPCTGHWPWQSFVADFHRFWAESDERRSPEINGDWSSFPG